MDLRYKDMNPEQRRAYHRAHTRRSYARNREARLEDGKRWRSENKDRMKALKKAWYLANPEKVKEMQKRCRKKNADKIRAKNLAYQRANRDKTRGWSRKHYVKSYAENPEKWINYTAARRAAIGGAKLTRNLAKRLIVEQGGKCKLCTCDLNVSGYHRDHIMPLSKGGKHVDENIQLLCPPCNLSKFNKI